MGLEIGMRLPEADFLEFDGAAFRTVAGTELFAGRTVLAGMPGAFTRTCDGAHLPSLIRAAEGLRAAGVGRIAVVAVNDPFVMRAWGEASGALAAGIEMLADADGAFTKAIGMAFDAPPVGLYGRSMRYGMLVEDGAVRVLNIEPSRSECTLSSGEALLEAIVAAA